MWRGDEEEREEQEKGTRAEMKEIGGGSEEEDRRRRAMMQKEKHIIYIEGGTEREREREREREMMVRYGSEGERLMTVRDEGREWKEKNIYNRAHWKRVTGRDKRVIEPVCSSTPYV